MTATPDLGPIDVSDFSLSAMLRTGIALRRAVRGCPTLESAAGTIVRYLYYHCVEPGTGSRTCVLARFYVTHPYDTLEPTLKRHVEASMQTPHPGMRCLTLLGTAGDEPAWNSRHLSREHGVIPLPSADVVRSTPMIGRLMEDLGVDIDSVVTGQEVRTHSMEALTYGVFHVEQARGSSVITAQDEFVIPYGVRSVVGFGGVQRSGELFAVVLFSRAPIPAASAHRFRTIALDIRSALFTLSETSVWGE